MSENKSLFLTDSPNVEQDSFQVHSSIANTLYDIITKHNVSENSFTIGLFGEWGSGKSFIINKLSNKIKEETSDVTFINIDVWKYSGQPLLRSILFELNKQFKSFYKNNKEKYEPFKDGYKNKKGKSLQDILYYDEVFESESRLSSEEFKKALKSLFTRYKTPIFILAFLFVCFIGFQFIPNDIVQSKWYLKIMQPIINGIATFGAFIGFVGIFIGLLQKPLKDIGNLIFFRNTVRNFTEKANFSPEQFEGIFKDFLSKIEDEKYVIVFDNVDRCEPGIAYETLSTIKTFMDIENCFYIIPADDDAIKNYLANSTVKQNDENSFERKFTEEFIDKIFQTYIRIPILKEDGIVPPVEPYSLDDKNYANKLAKEVANKLHLGNIEYIGGGANGFAYAVDNNTILKLTSDISEAEAALIIMRYKPKTLANVYHVYKIVDTETNKAYFAILEENIVNKPMDLFKKYEAELNKISSELSLPSIFDDIRKAKRFDYNQMIEKIKRVLTENPEADIPKEEREKLFNFLKGDTMEEFCRVSNVEKPKNTKIEFANIYFEYGIFEISSNNRTLLNGISKLMKKNKSLKIHLKGQTSTDYGKFHMELSKIRAEKVKGFLIKSGVSKNNIKISWTGKNNLTPEKNEYEKKINRKVKISVSN